MQAHTIAFKNKMLKINSIFVCIDCEIIAHWCPHQFTSCHYTCVPEPSIPLSALRLLVSPFQLLLAAMWRLAKQKDVMNYGKLQEFVFVVTEAIPGLMNQRQRAQLILGLRARVRKGSAPQQACCRLTFSLTILCHYSWFWSFAKAQLGVLLILKRSRAIWIDYR